jgi:hypothetical protein
VTDAALTLEDPTEGLVTPAEFGARVAAVIGREPYSRPAVHKWRQRGEVAPRYVDPDRGTAWYDPADAERVAKNRPAHGRGGARPGSGRPRRTATGRPDAPDPLADEDSLAARAAVAELRSELADRTEPPAGAIEPRDVALLTRDELAALARFPDESGPMTGAALARYAKLEEIRKKAIANERDAGNLVDKRTAARAWVKTVSALRAGLEGLPMAVAARVGPIAAPNDAELAQAGDLLLATGADPDAVNRALALVERPADCEDAVRTIVAAEVRRLLDELGGSEA